MRLSGPLYFDKDGVTKATLFARDIDDNGTMCEVELHIRGGKVEAVGVPPVIEPEEVVPATGARSTNSAVDHPLRADEFG